MTEVKQLIIDTDGATDDAQALLLALGQNTRVKVAAITTVRGVPGASQAAANVLRVLRIRDSLDVPVYIGAERGIVHYDHGCTYHGLDGFGDCPCPDAPSVERYARKADGTVPSMVTNNPGRYTLVCLGPLTNVALWMRCYPAIARSFKECFIMGGNMEAVGNYTLGAEFNFWCDPEAAHIVLSEMKCPVTIATWELCLKHAIPWEWYEQSRNRDTRAARFQKKIEQKIKAESKKSEFTGYIACDELAVAACLDKTIIAESHNVNVHVELSGKHTRGQLVCDRRATTKTDSKVTIITRLHDEKYRELLWSALT